jgi:hypothetical protein
MDDSLEFKEFISRDFGITILSKYSTKNHVGQFAERMEFLSDKDMYDVYPQLLLFCADSNGIILNTSLKARSVTLLLEGRE